MNDTYRAQLQALISGPKSAWERLIERYKGDRVVCNCRQAFYRGGHCSGGCQFNQLLARDEVAAGVLAELEDA